MLNALNIIPTPKKEWFTTWFDSPYYHILYKRRDDREAHAFIDRLEHHLGFNYDHDRILDLACGRGRHAIYLSKKGLDVVGIDLSPANIQFAKRFEHSGLEFVVHDMRELFCENKFDYILNLFTSFGYSDKVSENQSIISNASIALKKDGRLIIDFLNPGKIIKNLVPFELIVIDEIIFKISRCLTSSGFLEKDIKIKDKDEVFFFQERVMAISQAAFLEYFQKADLEVLDVFGDYNLNEYHEENSDRMIFIVQKNKNAF